jgi:IS5 family transposase
VTPANTHDSQALEHLLHGKETRLWGDSAYARQSEKIKAKAPKALNFTNEKGYRNTPLTEKQKRRIEPRQKYAPALSIPF